MIAHHLISLDEQRKQFAQSDINGADQEGFRGVHSDVGGGYPYSNFFSFITREVVIERAESRGLNIFNRAELTRYEHGHNHRRKYNLYKKQFKDGNLPKLRDVPTDNRKLGPVKYQKAERNFPSDMTKNESVHWFQ